ncbi:MAG TPA: hypothetical protein PKD91_12890 [Bacteroidia bacterium]|nr:hypothetical protein [Bacteroidia bacterium]
MKIAFTIHVTNVNSNITREVYSDISKLQSDLQFYKRKIKQGTFNMSVDWAVISNVSSITGIVGAIYVIYNDFLKKKTLEDKSTIIINFLNLNSPFLIEIDRTTSIDALKKQIESKVIESKAAIEKSNHWIEDMQNPELWEKQDPNN